MFTAIIAQKEFLDKISENQLFLEPFIDPKNVGFCEWFPEQERLKDMVPSLTDVVGRRKQWRALVICDEDCIHQHNPFDVVSFERENMQIDCESEEEAYEIQRIRAHESNMAAFEKAAQQPLTRLATFFCDHPTTTSKPAELEPDAAYIRYLHEINKKQELRRQIWSDELVFTTKPAQMLCVAKRTCAHSEREYELAWEAHNELEYSRFYDRNMYFDKMRYLVFDILPRTQRNYASDYMRFLYTTMVLAASEIPNGTLAANRVYSIQSESNDEVLQRLMHTYDTKLAITQEYLQERIRFLAGQKPGKLSDREVSQIFMPLSTVAVVQDTDRDLQELYVSSKEIGLSNGCPNEESVVWEAGYKRSKVELNRIMKQSRRSVNRSAKEIRGQNAYDLDKVNLLNENHKEDIREHISREELEMLSMDLPDLYNDEDYLKEMEKQDVAVRQKCRQRMTRSNTVVLGLLALLAYALGFITIFFRNASSNAFNFTTSLIITMSALALFALIMLVVLIFLRGGLTKLFRKYNRSMHDVCNRIYSSGTDYAVYFHHVANVRRGFAVLNAHANKRDPNVDKEILYKKHILDIEATRAQLQDLYGQYLVDPVALDLSNLAAYDMNFDRPVSYSYPVPYAESDRRNIPFLQSGATVQVPVDFVKSILIRREELYD